MTKRSRIFPDVDAVFKALADSTRRSLLDELFREDGQTLSSLETGTLLTTPGSLMYVQR